MEDQNMHLECDAAISKLTEAYNNLLAEKEALSASIAEQAKTITQLKGTVIAVNAKVEAPKIPTKVIEHRGKEYKFTVGHFSLAGRGKVLAEDAALDAELIADIISIEGQSILKEQA